MQSRNEIHINTIIIKTPPPTSPTLPHDTNYKQYMRRNSNAKVNLFV